MMKRIKEMKRMKNMNWMKVKEYRNINHMNVNFIYCTDG